MTSNLRIMHVTEGHSKAEGGVTSVVNDLTGNIKSLGVSSIVLGATDVKEYVPDGVRFYPLGCHGRSIGALFSGKLKKDIKRIIIENKIDVIHLHGFWLPLQLVTARVATELNIPFILTAHGMLEPWLWKGKGWKVFFKKKIYFKLFAYPVFRYAGFLHAITAMEKKSLGALFPDQKILINPNAITLKKAVPSSDVINKVIFFIGRLNPKKGVHLLLEAFQRLNLSDDWSMVIAGPNEVPQYTQELNNFVNEHGLLGEISFVGEVYGDEKDSLYKTSWITVVPSYSEVVGMVNLEAASHQCPSLTTNNTGLSDWESGGGLLFDPKVENLVEVLRTATQWDSSERLKRGWDSYQLVKQNYEWGVVGPRWVENYESLRRDFCEN